MDKYQSFKVFTCVAEKLSFSQAAEEMNLPNATVSTTVQDLEANLGARLLNRTTRKVSLTPEGLNFLDRCKDMLNDLEEAETMFRTEPSQIKGKIRVDMGVTTAKDLVIPLLPSFLEQYPEIEIELSSTDHTVDLVREGIDCVLRAGGEAEDELIEKELAEVVFVNCVSPSYIKKYGKPKTIEDLKKHRLIDFTQVFGQKVHGFEYFDGEKFREAKMKSVLTVNNTHSYGEACLAGLGIAQMSLVSAKRYMASGELVEVLPRYRAEPFQLKLVYHQRRLLTKRVRVFMEWLETIVREHFK